MVALKNSYGFNKLCTPMVFTVEGQLIGDSEDFQNWAKERFGREYSLPKEILIKRAKTN